jgi:predicted DNA-binding antitoxin AbrB/MazE fold protein
MLLPEDEVIEGVQGGRIEFNIILVDEYGRPIDTTNYDEFKICIKQSSSSSFDVSQTTTANGSVMTQVGDPMLGEYNVLIVPLDSVSLKDGDRQDIEITLTNTSDAKDVLKEIFKDRLNIKKSNCA